MPDISKLLQDKNADISLEELAQIGQIIEPDKMEDKINQAIEKYPF